MVTVAARELAAGEGSQRSSLVFSLRIGEERPFEYIAIISVAIMIQNSQPSFRGMSKGVVDKLQVIYIPYPTLFLRAETSLEHTYIRTEKIILIHIFRILLSMKIFRHT